MDKRLRKTFGNYTGRRSLEKAVTSRHKKGWLQKHIAEYVGVSAPTVSRILAEALSDTNTIPALGRPAKQLTGHALLDSLWL